MGDFLSGVIAILSALAVLSAIGVVVSRDNLYSALYLTITSAFVGAIYALLGIHTGFILIALIFIGATIGVTVILAATYRRVPAKPGAGKAWVIPVVLLACIAIAIGASAKTKALIAQSPNAFSQFTASLNNVLLLTVVVGLLTALMLGLIIYYIEVSKWRR